MSGSPWLAIGLRDGYLCCALPRPATPRQMDVLAAYVASGGSVPDAVRADGHSAEHGEAPPRRPACGVGLTTAQLIYAGRAAEWLPIPSLEPL